MATKGGIHGAWVGKRPGKRKWYSMIVDVLHSKVIICFLCTFGWLGLVLLLVVITSLKGADDFVESNCVVQNKETDPLNNSLCILGVFVDACNTTAKLNETYSGVALGCEPAANFSISSNLTCYTSDLCLEDQKALIHNPDPPFFSTPSSTDLIILLIAIALLPFGVLGTYLCNRVLLRISRDRELPF